MRLAPAYYTFFLIHDYGSAPWWQNQRVDASRSLATAFLSVPFYFLNISGYRLRSEAECVHRYYPNTFSFSNILGGCRVAEASAVDPAAERQLWGRMGRRL